jgi:glutaminase
MDPYSPARETRLDFAGILAEIHAQAGQLMGSGKVADYIPALADVNPRKFGLALTTVEGERFALGDAQESFSIQSISKLFTLSLALRIVGDELWTRCGREPSGSKFNSLVQLEHELGIPRNPFINAGALLVADQLVRRSANPRLLVLTLLRELSGNPAVNFDQEVARSEAQTGFRNAALVNFMKSFGVIDSPVDAVLDTYFHQCSIAMSCVDLARAGLFLANRGVDPQSAQCVLNPLQARRINALMLTCGLYDAVGDFAYDVGLPAKSGVGGGILAIVPGKLSICVWSPELDDSGNSVVGKECLRLFVERTGLSVF